jgi:hypothetical protein
MSDWVSIGPDDNPHAHMEVVVQQGSTLNHYVAKKEPVKQSERLRCKSKTVNFC